MKTRLLIVLFAVFTLSSCVSKFGVMKRRYTKGYHISLAKKKTVKPAMAKVARIHPDQQPTPVTQIAIRNVNRTVDLTEKQGSKQNTAHRLSPWAKTIQTRSDRAEANVLATPGHQRKIRPVEPALRQSIRYSPGGMSQNSVEPIVLIILCIFLPPLAVYLFQNSITTDFWLDLILTLIFWLPGIIYALLVCFGGVSLA